MRGRPGCPTEQKKHSVGATAGSPLFYFYKERLGTGSPPHPPQCAHWGTFPPRGRLWGWEELFPSAKPPLPARPAGGRAVTGVRYRAAGQAEKKRGPSQGPPKLEKVGPGRKNLFLPGVLSSGFLPKKAGPPPGAGRATGRCAPRAASEPPTRRVRSPAPACQGPHQIGTLFFAQFCATFLPPPCTPACNLGPGSPGGERRFCHAHPP